MEQSTSNIFQPGMNIDYVYDYGSSTELVLKVISDLPGKISGKEKIKLVARNNELVFKCTRCKKEIVHKRFVQSVSMKRIEIEHHSAIFV